MEPPEDQIVDIPKERLRFFGGPGKNAVLTLEHSNRVLKVSM
jgi:hypothetical protein